MGRGGTVYSRQNPQSPANRFSLPWATPLCRLEQAISSLMLYRHLGFSLQLVLFDRKPRQIQSCNTLTPRSEADKRVQVGGGEPPNPTNMPNSRI